MGNAYVTGVFYGIVTFGATTLKSKGQRDLFVAKVSPSGGFLWAIAAGGSGVACDWASLAVDSGDNAYIAASSCSDPNYSATTITLGSQVLPIKAGLDYHIVAKVSSAGVFSWAVQVEVPEVALCNGMFSLVLPRNIVIAADGTGSTYITGCFKGKATFGSTVLTTAQPGSYSDYYTNIYVARLSPSGAFLWAIGSGSANDDWARTIAVDASGNAVIAGAYPDYGTTTLGTTVLKPKDKWNLFLARVSPSGAFLSASSPGSVPAASNQGSPRSLGLDSTGNAYVTGYASAKATFGLLQPVEKSYVVKVSSAGIPLWVSSADTPNYTLFSDVAVDSVGAAHTTGDLQSFDSSTVTIGKTILTPSAGEFDDVVVVKVSPAGTFQAVLCTAHTLYSRAWGLGIALDSSDNSYVVGHFGGTVTFGSTTLTSKTNKAGIHTGDLFIWRIPAAKGSDAGP